MKKRFFTILCLIAAMLLSLSACGSGEAEKNPETALQAESTEEITEPELSAAEQIQQKFAGVDLGGKEFAILAPDASSHWIYSGNFNEVYAEEITGEVVNDQLFHRNHSIEELLHTVLRFDLQGAIGSIETIIANNVTAGDDTYALSLTTMTAQANNMMKGNLYNVHALEHLELSNPWWEKNQINTFTLDNKLYWLCGDINIGDDYAVQVLYFNKDMCSEFQLSNPYEAILDGTWTLDMLFDMTETVKTDTDGDGEMTLKDRWGVVDANDHIKHWMYSMGSRLIEVSEGNTLRLCSLDENHIQVVDTLFGYMVDREMMYPGNVNADVSAFTEGNTLFFSTQLWTLEQFRDMDDDFGIIPMPKLNEQQVGYGAYLSHGGATAFAVPVTVSTPAEVGMLLEVMGGLSADTLHSAFYDTLFASKLVRDTESVASLDTILSSKVYDWGVDFSWGADFNTVYGNIVVNKSNDLVSKMKSIEDKVQSKLDEVVAVIEELP